MSSIPNTHIDADSALISKLGGPAKVARLIGLHGLAVQRVHNWRTRGIPPAIKLSHPNLFMPELANTAQPASEVSTT